MSEAFFEFAQGIGDPLSHEMVRGAPMLWLSNAIFSISLIGVTISCFYFAEREKGAPSRFACGRAFFMQLTNYGTGLKVGLLPENKVVPGLQAPPPSGYTAPPATDAVQALKTVALWLIVWPL